MAMTRSGLPLPPTIFSGAAITSAPTAGVRRFDQLPAEARKYIARLEEVSGVRAAIVSTGSERDDTIVRDEVLQLPVTAAPIA